MTDESNVDEVMKGSIELEKTFKKFQDAHEALLIGDWVQYRSVAQVEVSGGLLLSVTC